MALRYPFTADCERCNRETPRTKRGQCVICGKRDRKAARRKKRLTLGSVAVVDFGALRDLADDLFSVWIRSTRVGCEMCSKKPLKPWELQNAHGFSRVHMRVRFNEDNVFALCPACHRKHSPSGPGWWVWMEQKIGEARYSRVEFLKSGGPRLYRSDILILACDYLGRIQRLPAGDVGEWARERAEEITARSKIALTPLPV